MNSVTSLRRRRGSSEQSPADAPHVNAERRRRLGLPSKPWLQFLLAFGVFAVLLVLVRGNLLWTSVVLNPDEAELMAEARSASIDLFPYRDYTSSTHLFLWPFALGVLGQVGVPLTLVTAHIIGGLAYVLVATTGWFLMMRRIGGVRAALLVLPTATVLLLGNGPPEFLSMMSEALPLAILCIAALVMLGPSRPMSTRQLIVGSMVAGLAIWAKPQSGPLAVALIGACIFMTCVERQRSEGDPSTGAVVRFILRAAALAVLAFLVPTLVFLAVMKLGGTLDDFVREPVAFIWGYTAHRDVTQGFAAPPLTDRLAAVSGFAASFPFAAAWALGGLLSMSLLTRLESKLLRGLGVASFILPVAAGLICLLPVNPLFPHYSNFLYLGCLLASCVGVRLATPTQDTARGKWIEGTYFGVSFAMVAMIMLANVPDHLTEMAGQARRALTGDGLSFHNKVPRASTPLAAACPAGSRVLAWGWASELYLYYDWVPASRYANATWLIQPAAHQAEYRSILLRELEQDPPDCIVEALGPAFFGSYDPANTLSAVVPGASPLLASCYRQTAAKTFWDGNPNVVATSEDRAVTLYRRTSSCAGS